MRLLEGTIRNMRAAFEERSREISAETDVSIAQELVLAGIVEAYV